MVVNINMFVVFYKQSEIEIKKSQFFYKILYD